MDLCGRHIFAPTLCVGVVHIIGGMYVILILKAYQVSKGQQSLIKLDANTSSKNMKVFLVYEYMAVVGI